MRAVLRTLSCGFVVSVVCAAVALAGSARAMASIDATRDAARAAQAVSDTAAPGLVEGAAFVMIPASGSPVATSTTPLAGFPTAGSDYLVMSSGNATVIG